MAPDYSIHDSAHEYYDLSSVGFIAAGACDSTSDPRLRYRREDRTIYVLEVQITTVEELSKMALVLEKHFPGHDVLIGKTENDDSDDTADQEEALDGMIVSALRLLGVSEREIFEIPDEIGSNFHASLQNAGSFAERYLVGRSLMRHHGWRDTIGDREDLRHLAEELAFAMRSISYSTRRGGHFASTIDLALSHLGEAIARVRNYPLAPAAEALGDADS